MENAIMLSQKKQFKINWAKIFVYFVLILLTISFLFPYVWLVSSSFKDNQAISSPTFSLLPRDMNGNIHFVFENYTSAIDYLNFGKVLGNTLIVCIVNTVLNLFLNCLAGYAFARIKFFGREVIFKIVLLSMMVPGAVMLIPNYIIIIKLHLDDTLLALILPFVMSVYNIFLLRQQFYSLSSEIEEAAEIDGASRFTTFLVIALPLVTPMLVVLGITTFMWNYNNFLWPLLVTTSEETFTLARSLGELVAAASEASFYPKMIAGSVIVSAPLIVLFFFLQKYIIAGISVGGVKG